MAVAVGRLLYASSRLQSLAIRGRTDWLFLRGSVRASVAVADFSDAADRTSEALNSSVKQACRIESGLTVDHGRFSDSVRKHVQLSARA